MKSFSHSFLRFLYQRGGSLITATLIIVGYTYLQSSPVLTKYGADLVTLLFIIVAVVVLIPVRDYLLKPFLLFPSWEALVETQYHHLEFLARPFTLHALLHQIVPNLLVWLRIPDARLLILQQERRYYDMYVYRQAALKGSRPIARKNIAPINGRFRQFGRIAFREDTTIPMYIENYMQKYRVAIAVPFLHRGRLLGMLLFHQPTANKHVERGLELFAAKATITIHDHILKSRMQNIAQYDEELRIATKIRQMLQMQETPQIEGWSLRSGKIRSATLIEYFKTTDRQYAVLLSTKAAGGVQAMILSGALGYLFAMTRIKGNGFRLYSLIRRLQNYLQINDLEGKLEILVLGLRPTANNATLAIIGKSTQNKNLAGNSYQMYNHNNEETDLAPGRISLDCKRNASYSLFYDNHEILSFSKVG